MCTAEQLGARPERYEVNACVSVPQTLRYLWIRRDDGIGRLEHPAFTGRERTRIETHQRGKPPPVVLSPIDRPLRSDEAGDGEKHIPL
jgi:hypothetical protein